MPSNSVSITGGNILEKQVYSIIEDHIHCNVVHPEQWIKHDSGTRLQTNQAVYLEKYRTEKHSLRFM